MTRLSAQILDYLDYLKNEKKSSSKTLENYQRYLKRLLDFTGDIDISQIDESLIIKFKVLLDEWIDPISGRRLKKVSQNYFLIAIRSLIRYLKQRGFELLDAKQVTLERIVRQKTATLDSDSLIKLLNAPDTSNQLGIRDRAIMELLFSTGLKVSELAGLNRKNINLVSKECLIIYRNGSSRVLMLSSEVSRWLNTYILSRKDTFWPLFIRTQGKTSAEHNGETMRLTVRSIERIVEKYVKRTKIPIKSTPLGLRHTFAKNLIQEGATLETLNKVLGHTHLASTQLYTRTLK